MGIKRNLSTRTSLLICSLHFYQPVLLNLIYKMTRSIEFESGSNVVDEKQRAFVEELEEPAHACRPRGYRPVTAEERALDKSLNLKLDCIVVVICAINFLVSKVSLLWSTVTDPFQATRS